MKRILAALVAALVLCSTTARAAKLSIKPGATDVSLIVFIQDSTSTAGAGKTGLVYNTGSLVCYYVRPGASAAQITLATQTVTGAHSDGGFVEIDATNMPGTYRLDLPDTVDAAGVRSAVVQCKGATGMAPLLLEIDLDAEVNVTHLNGTAQTGADLAANQTTILGHLNSSVYGLSVLHNDGTAILEEIGTAGAGLTALPAVTLADGAHGGSNTTITVGSPFGDRVVASESVYGTLETAVVTDIPQIVLNVGAEEALRKYIPTNYWLCGSEGMTVTYTGDTHGGKISLVAVGLNPLGGMAAGGELLGEIVGNTYTHITVEDDPAGEGALVISLNGTNATQDMEGGILTLSVPIYGLGTETYTIIVPNVTARTPTQGVTLYPDPVTGRCYQVRGGLVNGNHVALEAASGAIEAQTTAQAQRDALKLAPSTGAGAAGSVDALIGTPAVDLATDIAGVSGGTGLNAQETRDAMKLAPSTGAPAPGSVDSLLNTIKAK